MLLSEFLTYVKKDFKRTDKDAELVAAYNDMLFWVAVWMPVGNYQFQSYVTTSTGVEDYALPADILHMRHPIKLLYGTGTSDSGIQLKKITKEEYDELEPNPNRANATGGTPEFYTIYSRSILLTPIPDRDTYILEINRSKRPVDQVNDGDEPFLGDEWREVLKWGTLERVNAGLDLFDESAFWGSKYHDQSGSPTGMCKRLFELETEREGRSVDSIENNAL